MPNTDLSECLFDSGHDIREHQFVGFVSSDTNKSNILNSFHLHSFVTFYTEMQKKKFHHMYSHNKASHSVKYAGSIDAIGSVNAVGED